MNRSPVSTAIVPATSTVALPWIERFFEEAPKVILGKDHQLRSALCCLLAQGHLLIEDIPGVGKTTMVKLLAQLLGLSASRIQFTNDLLPADILGTSIFDAKTTEFHFHPGPIFAQVVIADELNRATPKTQSACLQAMEERQVSLDGKTYSLPQPFFLIATQNPKEQAGTYPLPESQMDRFLMRIELGYPDRAAEHELLRGGRRDLHIGDLKPICSVGELLSAQKAVESVHASDAVIDYVQDLMANSRSHSPDHRGVSPRAGLALIQAARAWAFMHGRSMVLPEDVQAIAIPVMAHRMERGEPWSRSSGSDAVREILEQVKVDA